MSNRVSKEIDRAADKLGIDRKVIDDLQEEMHDAVLALAVPWFKRAFSFIVSKITGK